MWVTVIIDLFIYTIASAEQLCVQKLVFSFFWETNPKDAEYQAIQGKHQRTHENSCITASRLLSFLGSKIACLGLGTRLSWDTCNLSEPLHCPLPSAAAAWKSACFLLVWCRSTSCSIAPAELPACSSTRTKTWRHFSQEEADLTASWFRRETLLIFPSSQK